MALGAGLEHSRAEEGTGGASPPLEGNIILQGENI